MVSAGHKCVGDTRGSGILAGSVHKCKGENGVRMWVQLKR